MRRLLTRLGIPAIAVGLLFSARLAQAVEPRRVAVTAVLHWAREPGAESCLSATELAHEVESRLRRPVFGSDRSPDMRLEGRIGRSYAEGAVWDASIVVHDASGNVLGQRRIASEREDCSALDDSLALIVALMVDLHTEEIVRAIEAAPPKGAATLRIPQPRPPRPARSSRVGLWAEAGPSTTYGLLPQAALGMRVSFGVDVPSLVPMELEAAALLPSERRTSTGGGRFTARYAGLSLCPVLIRSARIEPALCIGAQGGQMTGSGFGFQETYERHVLLVNAVGRVRAVIAINGWFGLSTALGMVVPLTRGRFVAEDQGTHEVHRAWSVVPLVELGARVRF